MEYGSDSEEYELYDSSSSSSDDDMEDMDGEFNMMFRVASGTSSSTHLFQSREWEDGGMHLVNPNEGACDALSCMRATSTLFKVNTNFILMELEELCMWVVLILLRNARSTGFEHIGPGRPFKLTPEQRILNFLLYLKHDNTVVFDTFTWNWSKTSINDDTIFVASCINDFLCHEIRWPTAAERVIVGQHTPEFQGCIGIIDGTLIRIRGPWNDPNHGRYFNGRKKMYCMNNLVIVDHHGLFIYLEAGFPGAYHDINGLCHSSLNDEWRNYFTHTDEYFEYVLGDVSYQGREAFIMRRVGAHEIAADQDETAISAYNKMHAGYWVLVEWGIGGLKMKWRCLMKRFDATKPKFEHMFRAGAILTNFLHQKRHDLSYQVIGGQNGDENEHDWDGDY